MRSRKIAANYIYLPGYRLLKNGYVILEDERVTDIVDTGGIMKEIQGLEFYGGLLVPGYLKGMEGEFRNGDDVRSVLDKLYRTRGEDYEGVAILEGADLVNLKWKESAKFRLLR